MFMTLFICSPRCFDIESSWCRRRWDIYRGRCIQIWIVDVTRRSWRRHVGESGDGRRLFLRAGYSIPSSRARAREMRKTSWARLFVPRCEIYIRNNVWFIGTERTNRSCLSQRCVSEQIFLWLSNIISVVHWMRWRASELSFTIIYRWRHFIEICFLFLH